MYLESFNQPVLHHLRVGVACKVAQGHCYIGVAFAPNTLLDGQCFLIEMSSLLFMALPSVSEANVGAGKPTRYCPTLKWVLVNTQP